MSDQEPQTEHLDLLLQASAMLNSTLSLDGVLAYLLREARKIVKAQNGMILLRQEGEWVIKIAVPGGDEVYFSRTIVNQVAEEQQTVCLLDASQDASFGALSSIQSTNLRSVICAPLVWKGNVKGVIYLDHRVSEGVFKEEHKRLIEALSQQAAVALENAALHEERELLHEIALESTTSLLADTQSQLFDAHELTSLVAQYLKAPLKEWENSCGQIIEKSEDPETLQLLADMQKSQTQMRSMLGKIISFVEPDRSKWKTFGLDELLEEALDLYLPRVENITVERDLAPIQVSGDRLTLSRVFMALLGNAEDALAGVERARRIQVRCFQDGNTPFFEVRDNGTGMTEEIRRRLFEPFFSTRGVNFRVGLGLAMSREVLRQHGAEIAVETAAGQGTRVVVKFPPPYL